MIDYPYEKAGINLRSDTSTLPTQEMLKAMAHARLGDDSYREDPTVEKLEAMSASILNKQAALFMPSGTMGNLIALIAHKGNCRNFIVDEKAHVLKSEKRGFEKIAGLIAEEVPITNDLIDIDSIKSRIVELLKKDDKPALMWIENSHNLSGGRVIQIEKIKELSALLKENNIPLHLDGARVFNAAISLDVDVKEISQFADSILFCLSKGLSCPVGSLLVGNSDFITEARSIRKMIGGTMRQAGVIAAAGIVALETMIDRLREDHRRAKQLAYLINKLPEVNIDMESVQTNMVYIDISPSNLNSDKFAKDMKQRGLIVSERPPQSIRLVTHRHITDEDIIKTAKIITEYFSE